VQCWLAAARVPEKDPTKTPVRPSVRRKQHFNHRRPTTAGLAGGHTPATLHYTTIHCYSSQTGKEQQHAMHARAERESLTLRQACSQETPGSAMCVQSLDDSRGFAIRITYRISLRSSSLWEPRHPLLKVVGLYIQFYCPHRPHNTTLESNPIQSNLIQSSQLDSTRLHLTRLDSRLCLSIGKAAFHGPTRRAGENELQQGGAQKSKQLTHARPLELHYYAESTLPKLTLAGLTDVANTKQDGKKAENTYQRPPNHASKHKHTHTCMHACMQANKRASEPAGTFPSQNR
jgi:hypothetical protein